MKRKMVAVLLSGILVASSLTCVQVGGALIAVAAETSETKTFKMERTNVPMYNDNGVSIALESCNYTQDASDIMFRYDIRNESKSIVKATMDDLLVDGVEMSMLMGGNSFEVKAGERWSVGFYIGLDDLKNAGVSDFAQITYTLNISLGDEQVASIPVVIERKESTVTSDAGNDEAVKTLESEKAELEEKVSQLESENASLESENASLKKQVEELKNGEATDQTETETETEVSEQSNDEWTKETLAGLACTLLKLSLKDPYSLVINEIDYGTNGYTNSYGTYSGLPSVKIVCHANNGYGNSVIGEYYAFVWPYDTTPSGFTHIRHKCIPDGRYLVLGTDYDGMDRQFVKSEKLNVDEITSIMDDFLEKEEYY